MHATYKVRNGSSTQIDKQYVNNSILLIGKLDTEMSM